LPDSAQCDWKRHRLSDSPPGAASFQDPRLANCGSMEELCPQISSPSYGQNSRCLRSSHSSLPRRSLRASRPCRFAPLVFMALSRRCMRRRMLRGFYRLFRSTTLRTAPSFLQASRHPRSCGGMRRELPGASTSSLPTSLRQSTQFQGESGCTWEPSIRTASRIPTRLPN